MNRKILSALAATALTLGAWAAAPAAQAATYVQAQVQVAPPVYVQPAPQPPLYAQDWGHEQRRWHREHERRGEACRAARWEPNARYMPGDAVWRHGQLYMATGLSARVWNVNSPPEWTPNYWVPARCD